MSPDTNHFVVNIVCPADNTLRPMEINSVDLPGGEKFVLPVNGCDNYAASDLCQKCRAAVTLMFHSGYRPEIGKSVIPDFEVLK